MVEEKKSTLISTLKDIMYVGSEELMAQNMAEIIINNAIKFTPEGGKISVSFPQREEYFGGDMGQRSVYSP